jgi:hypothetical protein
VKADQLDSLLCCLWLLTLVVGFVGLWVSMLAFAILRELREQRTLHAHICLHQRFGEEEAEGEDWKHGGQEE